MKYLAAVALATLFATTFLCYLIGAFVWATFEVSLWADRVGITVFWTSLSVPSIIGAVGVADDQRNKWYNNQYWEFKQFLRKQQEQKDANI